MEAELLEQFKELDLNGDVSNLRLKSKVKSGTRGMKKFSRRWIKMAMGKSPLKVFIFSLFLPPQFDDFFLAFQNG